MTQLSQLGFWMFSGALGAVGVAATVGVLDQPPRSEQIAKTALVGEQISGGNAAKKQADKEVAKLSPKPDATAEKPKVVTPEVIIPTFDILRVENDGSTLIAGNAEPGSKVEIFDGITIVATTTASGNGDFVAILETPLSPGEHQLGIRATDNNSKIQVSMETGLVSMPKKKDGQLLAMVMKPGEASRIIQKPEAAKPVEAAKVAPTVNETSPEKPTKPVEVAKVEPAKTKKETKVEAEKTNPVEVAKAEVAKIEAAKVEPTKPAETVAKTETKEPVAKVVIESAKAATEPEKIATKKTEPQQVALAKLENTTKVTVEKKTPEVIGAKKPAKPAKEKVIAPKEVTKLNSTAVSTVTPKTATTKKAALSPKKLANRAEPAKVVVQPSTQIGAPPKIAKEAPKENIQLASKPVEAKSAKPTAPAKENVVVAFKKPIVEKAVKKPQQVEKTPIIIVEAVEIDGLRMFIAGAAEPGRRVALYVDNKFVGFADGSREGRFLLEVERALSRGEHVVRADIYDAKGALVAARAEVPLIHEPEEPAIVVAKVEPGAKPSVKKVKEAANVVDKAVEPAAKQQPLAQKPEMKKVAAKTTPVPKAKPKISVAKKTEATQKPLKMAKAQKPAKTFEPVKTAKQVAPAMAEKKPVAKIVVDNKQTPKQSKSVKVAVVEPKKSEAVVTPAKPAEAKIIAAMPVEKSKPMAVKTAAKTTNSATTPTVAQTAAPAKTPDAPAKKLAIVEPKAQVKVASAEQKTSKIPATRRVLRTGSSVIIRRGDSLWRISYRTYGRGIRYSTIYQANLNQLRSPHRIYPGQILKVPKKKFSQQG